MPIERAFQKGFMGIEEEKMPIDITKTFAIYIKM